jgi:hypothetical protein
MRLIKFQFSVYENYYYYVTENIKEDKKRIRVLSYLKASPFSFLFPSQFTTHNWKSPSSIAKQVLFFFFLIIKFKLNGLFEKKKMKINWLRFMHLQWS